MADAATEADYNVVKLRIWARQWRASKLAPKKYGDRSDVNVTQTIDVADRITRRWKENWPWVLNGLEPLPPRVIEGGKGRCGSERAARRDASPDRSGVGYGAERWQCPGHTGSAG